MVKLILHLIPERGLDDRGEKSLYINAINKYSRIDLTNGNRPKAANTRFEKH